MQIEIVLILRDTGSRNNYIPHVACRLSAPDCGLRLISSFTSLCTLTLSLSQALCIKKLKLNAPNKLNVHQISLPPTK